MKYTFAVILGGLSFAFLAAPSLAVAAKPAKSAPLKVTLNQITVEGVGPAMGSVSIRPTKDGVELAVDLAGLSPGEHGFHLHERGSCDPADKDGKKTSGQSAGPHWDPGATKAHKGPGGGGHKGDLPKLMVPADGKVKVKLTVAGLTTADLAGRSLMIHAGGDTYSDAPKPLGGGGDRIVCGVVPGVATPSPAPPAVPAAAGPAPPGDSKKPGDNKAAPKAAAP